MKIKMIRGALIGSQAVKPGSEIEVAEGLGRELIASGKAEKVELPELPKELQAEPKPKAKKGKK